MTALNEYQRLECSGVWRETPEEQRKDVLVSLGDATLVIYDAAGRALAHWSLPTVVRLNTGAEQAIYSPGGDAPEELEIDEPTMIAAIEQIRATIERRRPRQGRLRFVIMAAALVGVIGLAVYWVPNALMRQAANIMPPAKRLEIGVRLLANIQRLAGRPCETPAGATALEKLHARLMPNLPGTLIVLSSGSGITSHLPGGLILLNRTLVEDYDTPDVVAGFILAEALRAEITDPIADLLNNAGPVTAARLLTTGDIPDPVLESYAEVLMTRAPRKVADQELLANFRRARVSSAPYAYARDISGERTLGLIEADPGSAVAVLPDGDWVSLQGICGE